MVHQVGWTTAATVGNRHRKKERKPLGKQMPRLWQHRLLLTTIRTAIAMMKMMTVVLLVLLALVLGARWWFLDTPRRQRVFLTTQEEAP